MESFWLKQYCPKVIDFISDVTTFADNAKEIVSACRVFAWNEEDRLNENKRTMYLNFWKRFIDKSVFLEKLEKEIELAKISNRGNEKVIGILKKMEKKVKTLKDLYKLFRVAYERMKDKNRPEDYLFGEKIAKPLRLNLAKLSTLMEIGEESFWHL